MENSISQKRQIISSFYLSAVLIGVIFSLIVIVYGAESVAPGVHDAFHDFRHAIGMACH